MEEHLEAIKRTYKDFHAFLLRKGKLPMKDTGIGFWNPSHPDEIFAMCKRIGLDKKKSFLDLGSGDGIPVMVASLFTKSTGIEHDSWLHSVATDIQSKLADVPGVPEAVFLNQDYLDHDLSRYDVLFLAPDKPLWRGVEQKLKQELKGSLIIYGHHFHPRDLKKKESFTINGTLISVYENR